MEFWNSLIDSDKKKRSMLFSIGAHIVLIVLLLYPWLSYQDPPPEQQGVLITFGAPDVGDGNDAAIAQNEEQVEEPAEESSPSETVPIEKIKQEESKPTKSVATEADVLTSQEKEAIRLKKAQEKEAQEKKEAEKAQKEAERERQRKAEAARKAEQQKKEDAKRKFSSVFGSGRGETGTSGNQGDPDGDPDKGKLSGISTGSGMVGGGLGSRGVASVPKINDRSQKAGKVVVDVCVDKSGKVISATYTQRGSTTTDRELREIAEKNARKFSFTPSDIDKQCGTITIDFKLK